MKLQEFIVQPDADEDVKAAFRDYAYEHRLDCRLSDSTVSTGCAAGGKDFTVRGYHAMRDIRLDDGQDLCPTCMQGLRGA